MTNNTDISPERVNAHLHHPQLHLLAIERTGWRRWIFGRWAYSSEPFRRDIQRKCASLEIPVRKHHTLGPEWEHSRADRQRTCEDGDSHE